MGICGCLPSGIDGLLPSKTEYEEFLTISNGNMRCFKATKIAKKWNNSGVLTPMMIQNWRFQNP
jgi:hypothetical protein